MRCWIIFLFSAFLFSCSEKPQAVIVEGVLEVPENRGNPDSRTLKLVYKVLKAKNANSNKNPILYLQGGPGGATLIMEPYWTNHPLRNDRDIVLMDQRGTGLSEAICSKSSATAMVILRKDLNQEEEYKALDAMLSKCKQIIKDKKVDVSGYNSRENAADFEDLRLALGYEKWNLFGGSYGSRLGLTIMRDFPNSVRSAILFSIFAPESHLYKSFIQNFENSLFSVLARCESSKNCEKLYPDLKTRLLKSLEKMQKEPLKLEYQGDMFVLNPQDVLLLLHQSLYNRNSISNIPKFIVALETLEEQSIINFIDRTSSSFNIINIPMYLSVTGYEELPFNDETDFNENLKRQSKIGVGPAFFGSDAKILKKWHSYRANEFENQPVISEIPTLMASGSLDPITSTSNAKESLKYLENSYEIIFPDESHNLLNPCFFEICKDFLDEPYQKPNLECSKAHNPLQWN